MSHLPFATVWISGAGSVTLAPVMPIDYDLLRVVFALPVLSFLATLALVPFVRKWAALSGFVDRPGGRKQHEGAVPPVGGVVIFCVFLFLSLFTEESVGGTWSFFAALALILLAGVADDSRGLDPRLKFSVHFLAAFILVLGGEVRVETLGDLLGFGEVTLGWFSIPFSVACVVYMVNAINMMDGIDGLAAGKSLMILLWLMAACLLGDWREPLGPMGILAAALAG